MAKNYLSSSLIDKLESDLRQEFPNLTIERTDNSIRVPPNTENGFAVELIDVINEIVPVLGNWVQYGLDKNLAIPIFQAGLRGDARLHEISRAGVAYHWRVEYFRNGVWMKEKKTIIIHFHSSHGFFYFWGVYKNEFCTTTQTDCARIFRKVQFFIVDYLLRNATQRSVQRTGGILRHF